MLVVLYIFVNLLFSQIDTLDALRYYPLAVGNKWQYAQYDYLGNFERYSTTEIVGDTILPNGYRYFVSSNNRYLRIDTSEVAVYFYSIHFGFDTLEFKLGITEVDTTPSYLGIMNDFFTGNGCAGQISYTTPYKFYEYFWLDEYHQYKLSKDIGLSFTRYAYFIQPWCYVERLLIGAKIGDQVYGQFVGIELEEKNIAAYKLYQNYPNPFNATTTIPYEVKHSGKVKISIYDIGGNLKKILLDRYQEVGQYSIKWNALGFNSGIYMYKIETGNNQEVKKCLLIK